MSIAFHCDHCGKKIEAQDSASGKWGRCPTCHNKVYIPGLDSGEELKLASIDEGGETKQKELMTETYKLEQDILLEREDPAGADVSASQMSDKEITKNIILYLRQMADGELNEAEQVAGLITPCGSKAVEILDRIALSEIPEPELADISGQVLAGLIRTLRNKIS